MFSFATAYEFQHRPSSPHFPQSNGQAERVIQTAKRLLKKSPSDPYQALLVYRSAPLHWCGYSPAQLLIGRQLRTTLPLQQQQLVPDWSYLDQFCQQDKMFKQRQKQGYNTHHRTCPLPELSEQTGGDTFVFQGGLGEFLPRLLLEERTDNKASIVYSKRLLTTSCELTPGLAFQ